MSVEDNFWLAEATGAERSFRYPNVNVQLTMLFMGLVTEIRARYDWWVI